MHVPWWLPFGRAEEISPRELEAKLKNGARVQVLDVREPFEYQQGHIQGALSVPIHDLPNKSPHLGLDPERPIVAICLSGHRSIPAYRLLKRAGYRQVYSLEGGMLAWWRAQLPTTREGKE